VRYTSSMPEYEYPRPALTADVVLVRDDAGAREVLLIKRRFEPFAGRWALPGGFVDEGEVPEAAARRELAEETGVIWEGSLTLVGVFGRPGRDPRGWTVSAVYLADVGGVSVDARAGDDAAETAWFPLDRLPSLAFDHDEVLAEARRLLR